MIERFNKSSMVNIEIVKRQRREQPNRFSKPVRFEYELNVVIKMNTQYYSKNIIPSGMNRSVKNEIYRTGCIPYGMHPKDCNIFLPSVTSLTACLDNSNYYKVNKYNIKY
ncbi:MAG: hypothetical protein LBC68_15220 [Prevotellaceae bacterium]|jgi:hypothetical protein|nr:hypothetical protein [Prevotellaceae bacterium]